LHKVGSAGKPPLFVDVRIVGDQGNELGPGETGGLWVRGPNVMAGYFRRPDATAEVLSPDGWLRTGDAARKDDDGYVWMVDRVSARFAAGGKVVYPGDVKRVLFEHPSVDDAAVARVEMRGPVAIVAFVVPSSPPPSEPELPALCRTRLAAHQVPSAVAFVERLPRNSVGKLDRAALAAPGRDPPFAL
jgi:acyl-CoA synthetase (AMP-forming)/AMP-acid ligase II